MGNVEKHSSFISQHYQKEQIQRALKKEKRALEAAERLLENKSRELKEVSEYFKEASRRLDVLVTNSENLVDEAFLEIIDPYVVMDLNSRVLNMNASAKEFLGFDHEKDQLKLKDLVKPEYKTYTETSFVQLMQEGFIKNYRPIITTLHGEDKQISINASLIYDAEGNAIAVQGIISDITEEVSNRNDLDQQQQIFKTLFDHSPVGMLLLKEDKINTGNQAFCHFLGISSIEEIIGKGLDDISTIDDIQPYKDLLHQNNNQQTAVIRRFTRKDGSYVLGKTTKSNVPGGGENLVLSVAIIQDVHQQERSVELVEKLKIQQNNIIQNLQDGILVENAERKLLITNTRFCELFGITTPPEKLKGVNCQRSLHAYKQLFKNPDAFVETTETTVSDQKKVIGQELELVDGRCFSRDFIPLFEEGEFTGHIWIYQDITEDRKPITVITTDKDEFNGIIANMNLGMVEIDALNRIVVANKHYAAMVGLTEEDLKDKNIFDIMNLDGENTAIMNTQLDKLRKGQAGSYELSLKLPNGDKRHWMINSAPRYSDKGFVVGSVGVHLDITQQKEWELQKENLVKSLEESNKGLQEYAHVVSHDLKSPLRSVSALATWLYDDYKDQLDESGRYNLKMMQEKIEGMDKLIEGILKYSTVNKDNLDNTAVDINQVIREIKEIIYIPEHVSIKIANPLPTILADKTQIHQLFQNFISNAAVNIDKEVGVIEIASTQTNTHWEFSIKDNGVGIPKEYHERIFKIFESIGSKERSTGIGLSIVKKIIDLYEGKVSVESELGKGTTFTFSLKKY